MLILTFFLLSLVSALIYCFRFGRVSGIKDCWKPLLVFVAVFAALNLTYVLIVYLISLFFRESRIKPIKKQSELCRLICSFSAGMVCTYAGVRAHITGSEKLPENDRFLYVCNHLSGFDPLVMLSRLRKFNISFISKPSNLELPLVGNVGCAAGCLAINREDNREALKTINTAADYIKNDICSLAIYPEGTRSKTGELADFHPGSFKIAKKADCPVVIACSTGTNHVKHNVLSGGTDVHLDILEVIPVERVREMTTVQLAEYSHKLISDFQKSGLRAC